MNMKAVVTTHVCSDCIKQGVCEFCSSYKDDCNRIAEAISHHHIISVNIRCDFYEEKPLYKAVCPRGFVDCVYDPAYIKFNYPDWYKELYDTLTPEEAIKVENGCYERSMKDPDMKYYCYYT